MEAPRPQDRPPDTQDMNTNGLPDIATNNEHGLFTKNTPETLYTNNEHDPGPKGMENASTTLYNHNPRPPTQWILPNYVESTIKEIHCGNSNDV